MIVVGMLVLAVAVAAAIVAIAQNQSAMVEVHGLGYTWNVHVYWVLVAGLVIAAVAFFGVAVMRAGSAHSARLRTERRNLRRENARLNDVAAERPAPAVVNAPEPAAARAEGYESGYEPAPTARHGLFHRTRHV
jgi:hypothetical protein